MLHTIWSTAAKYDAMRTRRVVDQWHVDTRKVSAIYMNGFNQDLLLVVVGAGANKGQFKTAGSR